MAPMLAGANMIYGCGMLDTGNVADFGALVADNELVGLLKHVMRGVCVTEEEIAMDVMRRVGPRGNFLSDQHTFERIRSNSLGNFIIDRQKRDNWVNDGGKDLDTRATEKALEILKTHKVEPLPEKTRAKLSEIIAEAEKDLGGSKS